MSQIRKLRQNANITQERFAQLVGVTVSSVQKWELGKRAPRAKKLKAIARVLKCDVAALL